MMSSTANFDRRQFLAVSGAMAVGMTAHFSAASGSSHDRFDYIVVGAGSSGSAVAARLSEDSSTRVLLLEAGPLDDSPMISTPHDYSELKGSKYDWRFDTVPQHALGDRAIPWPRGKVLGGSSSINAMLYIRGNRLDFDHWNYLGNRGWAYQDVLPLFKKSEHNYYYDQTAVDKKYHGTTGPLTVTNPPWRSAAGESFVQAAGEAGFRIHKDLNWDFNGIEQSGAAGFFQLTVTPQGKRCNTAHAFLRPARERSNLTVLTGAFVARLLFDRPHQVIGVSFQHEGRVARALADREVILSAGSVMSPVVMMLSGIGPAEQLRRLRIPVVLDAKGVGQNLQDHFIYAIDYESKVRLAPIFASGAEASLFIRTQSSLTQASPDLQYHFWYDNETDRSTYSFAPTLTQPYSIGDITLRANDPNEKPIIQPNYLQCERDLDTMIYGFDLARELNGARAFERIRGRELNPGSNCKTRDDKIRFIRSVGRTIYHPVGTCRMGSDRDAVVDDELRVRGLTGLRIVDASIMPKVVAGNTNAASIMIGEKAAELITSSQKGAAGDAGNR
jgi:choline dehydrogenase